MIRQSSGAIVASPTPDGEEETLIKVLTINKKVRRVGSWSATSASRWRQAT